jgi:hypothetical protein
VTTPNTLPARFLNGPRRLGKLSITPTRWIGTLLLTATLLGAATTTLAASITGNPSVDSGWTTAGNSLDNGVYIRGAGNFGYDLYTTGFTIQPGSPLLASGWSLGDSVVAVGGQIATTDGVSAGWGLAFTGDAVNSNLTASVRIVSKFGTSPTSWSASTVRPNAGNGDGSTSGGYGGEGAILLGTNVGDLVSANTLMTVSLNQRYTNGGATVTNQSNDIGRLIFQTSGGFLSSWEMFLNTTELAGALAPGAEIPLIGDRINQTLQRSTNSTLFTDAMVTIQGVPEPASIVIAGLGILGVLATVRRRKVLA